MLTESRLISLIVKQIVSADKIKELESSISTYKIDWKGFKEFLVYHELTPFAYLALKDFNPFLPQDLWEFLKNNYYCALVHCQNLWQEFLRIFDAFGEAGISLLPIKGIAFLHDLYSHKPARPMTDMDLLVREGDLQKAEAIFYDLGYRKELYGLKEEYWKKKQIHFTFYKKEDEKLPFVELHWSLDFKRKNQTIFPELWSRVREINVNGRVIKLLSPEDNLFSLALHNRRFGRTLCLKNAYDTILLLNKYGYDFDWDYCLDISRRYSLNTTLFFILYQAKFLLEINLPEGVWKGLNLPAWKKRIIRNFIQTNSFSEKKLRNKNLYLKSHFLLYDNFWEPINYIINIPKEQFAKYYGLNPYDKRTDFLYRNRLFYILSKLISKWSR